MNKPEYYTDAQLLRIKAEEKLKNKLKSKSTDDTEHDAQKLLHELQVHQIELEMQNEELREATEAAQVALKKYTMLYDLAPMGYFTLNHDGAILELNFTGAEMLGDRRFSLVGSNFKLYVADESKPIFNEFFSRVFDENSKESCEVKLGYDKMPLGYFYMEAVFIGDENKCLLSLINISNLKV
ncbi:MAG: PAS domain-containing protein [Paludibacter sp.]|nr:PAS domain-containing protein [Paludibacter sp.]